jgi:hypothetical protein
MVHLVLAALGAVAVETKSLVGHELLAASVESGTKGDTKDDAERDQLRGNLSELAQALGDGVGW